ncbi:MAG: APC family permease [Acidobacteriota bacterium]
MIEGSVSSRLLDVVGKARHAVIGRPKDPSDPQVFHQISLLAFFAWVGLGSDGLSSSCYGPEETVRALGGHSELGIIVALASALTIFIISSSYHQIIELFPTGGGGYVVASKLLSPEIGMISGCALIVDYVLTISISVSSGADALFSFLPHGWLSYKVAAIVAGVLVLIVMNLRGVKESVVPLVPIFLIFIVTHLFAVLYTFASHGRDLQRVVGETTAGFQSSISQLGLLGSIVLIMKAYSMGAGTFTGIEAVSNGLPILREPRVRTARRTMWYMSISLAAMVIGLIVGYILWGVHPTPDMSKTLNALFLERMVASWSWGWGRVFLTVTLVSEALLLFIAAQTGFLDGPRVLANMALDRWIPTKFSMLSNRLVTQNGILLMGAAALVTVYASHGSVRLLVVLYAINVFITFALSQLGMVRHWWQSRASADSWRRKLAINGIGLVLTLFILISVVILKFEEGGWITIFVTGSLAFVFVLIRRHYRAAQRQLEKLNDLMQLVTDEKAPISPRTDRTGLPAYDPAGKTAVVLVNGYNGIGLHTLLNIFKLFPETFKNFVFVCVGMIDAGNFKGAGEVEKLSAHVKGETHLYVEYMTQLGYHAEGYTAVGNDVVKEVMDLTPRIFEMFPNCIVFGGQIVFKEETFITRLLHNYLTFALQRGFYHEGTPFVIVPIRV